MTNAEIIRRLRNDAAGLDQQGANLYRVRAYRQAAFRLSQLNEPIADLGPAHLQEIGIGRHLASTVYQWALDAVEAEVTNET